VQILVLGTFVKSAKVQILVLGTFVKSAKVQSA